MELQKASIDFLAVVAWIMSIDKLLLFCSLVVNKTKVWSLLLGHSGGLRSAIRMMKDGCFC